MADDISIVVRAEDAFSGVLGNFGNIMTGIKSTIDLVGMAFNTAKDLLQPFIDSASESEQALVGLETVLKSTGDTVGLTSEQLQQMATDLQGVTRYSDEQIMSAESMLLRFENLNGIFDDALKLTTDYAASLKIDLTTAAQTVGKALDDPASGIGRLNTQFKLFNETEMETIKKMAENGDVAGAQAMIMDRLREKVGGAAEAYGNTFAGQLDIAKNSLDDLQEIVGGAVLPKLTELLTWFTTFVQSPEVKEFASLIAEGISTGDFSGLDNFVGKLFLSLSNSIQDWIDGGGAEELSNKIVSWIDGIGTGEETNSKMLIAGKHLLNVLLDAIDEIDWSEIAVHLDAKIALSISEHDWQNIGDIVGDAIEKFFTEGWNKGTDQAANNIKSSSWTAIQDAFKDFFVGAIGGPEVAAYWKSAWENLVDHVKIWARFGWDDVGKAIVEGLKDGVNWAWGNFKSLFSFGFDDIIKYVKNLLGIHSASTVFKDISKNIVQGLIDGWSELFTTFKSLISSGIDEILKLFAPFLALFGIDVSSSGGGTTGGASGTFGGFGTGTTSSGSSQAGQTVNNYFYGNVYFNQSAQDTNYDCPSPNPLMTAGGGTLVPHAL